MRDQSQNRADPVEEVSSTISINSTAERVWATVTDIERMAGVNPLMLRARWLDGVREASLGARFSSDNVHEDLGVWNATSEVVEWIPHQAIAWTIESPSAPAIVCRFDITAEGSRTTLRQTYFIDPRPGARPPVARALCHRC